MFYRILIVTFLTISIFCVLGEIVLRNFTYYGIEYYLEFDTKACRIVNDGEFCYYVDKSILEGWKRLAQNIKVKKDKSQSDTFYRIIVLGDSIAAGGKLKKGELAFPDILKVILQKEYPEIDFEVLVFGGGGYSTVEEVAAYEKYGKSFKPDLLILAYCHNDTAEAYPNIIKRKDKYLLAFYKTGVPYFNKIPLNRFFIERFLIVRLINESLIRFFYRNRISVSFNFCLLADQRIYRGFEKLFLLTKDTGTTTTVVVFPYFVERMDLDLDKIRMAGLIKEWCQKLNFLYIDLLEAYQGYDYKLLRCQPTDPCHPNALGHRIAAEVIAKEIKKNALIK